MTKGKVKFIGYILFLLLAAAAVAGGLLFYPVFKNTETKYLYVDSDDTMDSLYAKVSSVEQVGFGMTGFKLMSSLKHFTQPRTGYYAIEPGTNEFTCVRHFANGLQTPINLTIPEVRTIEEMTQRVSAQLMISAQDLEAVLSDSTYMASLGYSKATLPCLFVPNTYEVYWNISAQDLVIRLNKEKEAFWNDERLSKAKAMDMTPEQIVTLASIVDSETSYGPEKPRIAGLYIHRMQVEMPLQSDPTVIYALGDFKIRRVSLEQTRYKSSYNTYMNQGLPPGPIRIPSIQGIDAVLNYEHNSYLYMCAKEDFSGSHNFTSSYKEHLENAHRYQRALNERNIKK